MLKHGLSTLLTMANAETRRARRRHGRHGGIRIQSELSASEHVCVQLHTDRVRVALMSRLNGVLLTKEFPRDPKRPPCSPCLLRGLRVEAFAETRATRSLDILDFT